MRIEPVRRATTSITLALALAAALGSASASQPMTSVPKSGPIPETRNATGYPSVAAALAALRAKPGVRFADQQGWTIAEDRDATSATLWSFTPPGHPAHPAAVKRQITNENGAAVLNMSIQCEAAKAPCDDLVREFEALNERMKASIRNSR